METTVRKKTSSSRNSGGLKLAMPAPGVGTLPVQTICLDLANGPRAHVFGNANATVLPFLGI